MSDLAPKTLTSLRRWAKIFLLIGIITSASGIAHNIYVHFNPAAERTYGRLVHVSIGGRDFAIPSEYFRGPLPHGATKRLHLWVMMPDYTPYKGEVTGDQAQISAGWERHLIVNIDDTRVANDLASHYERQRSGLTSYVTQDVPDAQGMHRTLVWRSTPRSSQPFIDHDLYYQTAEDGKLRAFVSCDRDDAAKHPGCSFHEFQDGMLLYTLSYRKSNLPKWRQIQSGVHNLIESFSCVPQSKDISTKTHIGDKTCPR